MQSQPHALKKQTGGGKMMDQKNLGPEHEQSVWEREHNFQALKQVSCTFQNL